MASMFGMGALGKALGGDDAGPALGVIPSLALTARKKKKPVTGPSESTILTDAVSRRTSARY